MRPTLTIGYLVFVFLQSALIVRATGISTPTPSECLLIVDDDDDGYGVEQQETTAEKRAHLEQYVENYDGSGHSDTSFP